MINKKLQGQEFENVALSYLLERDFELIERNFLLPFGEIDLIMKKNNSIYFVEIRGRHAKRLGEAIDSLLPEKLKRIKKSAEAFLMQKTQWNTFVPYFSVVAIDVLADSSVHIEFLEDAFD